MSSKREEERNEKVIRGLLKLPPNRRCINCNGLGPQYVCTNFWTFVCTACSGIHREFTHRVKSVSMAKFTSQEVEALQNGGNQRARELFLKEWDMQNMKLPDSSYPDKIREFIKNVYVDKKYAVGKSSDMSPRDPQGFNSHEEEHRRASSYHSFSQSPPYDHQYEDRRYGKPRITLSRKPGSDHGHYEGNISSILSPGRDREHVYEDQFANESSSSRISDYSTSSAIDPFRPSGQSPSTHANPSSQQRSTSLGSFGSSESNTLYQKTVNLGALPGAVFEPVHDTIRQQSNSSTIASPKTSTPQNSSIIDLFSPQFMQQQSTKISVDFFADLNNQPSCTRSENMPPAVPTSQNQGWAIFDLAHQLTSDPVANKGLPPVMPPCIEESVGIIGSLSSKQDTSQQFSAQNSVVHGELASTTVQWHANLPGIKNTSDSSNIIPVWNAFDDSFEKNSQALHANSQVHVLVNGSVSSNFGGQYTDVALPKVLDHNILQSSNVLDNGIHYSSERIPSATLPCEGRSTQEWKSTNPFDLSYDLDAGTTNMFLDMSSLQAALPKPQLPNAFLDGVSEPWFQQNSASTFNPSISQAASPYLGGPVPTSQLPNIPSQGSTASRNPFA